MFKQYEKQSSTALTQQKGVRIQMREILYKQRQQVALLFSSDADLQHSTHHAPKALDNMAVK